ncbi:hypothetical protein BY996DRAFT_6413223 [Phakopsora pachyrhizi]|uniref:Expressed protein n=1 Tax=Phakopsora pachyrhizi TaxID=170000 RepID=A0AAV0AGV5_PHAPC|nr:hypothetical protein BY996DRAFT_6413223 [Phakopsora pachyrhizi]CAH7665883.1 expressed protein [Phakopsora pachyrhizi]
MISKKGFCILTIIIWALFTRMAYAALKINCLDRLVESFNVFSGPKPSFTELNLKKLETWDQETTAEDVLNFDKINRPRGFRALKFKSKDFSEDKELWASKLALLVQFVTDNNNEPEKVRYSLGVGWHLYSHLRQCEIYKKAFLNDFSEYFLSFFAFFHQLHKHENKNFDIPSFALEAFESVTQNHIRNAKNKSPDPQLYDHIAFDIDAEINYGLRLKPTVKKLELNKSNRDDVFDPAIGSMTNHF